MRQQELERQMDGLYASYCERTGTGDYARKRKNKRSKVPHIVFFSRLELYYKSPNFGELQFKPRT